jgi:hypothetical protein
MVVYLVLCSEAATLLIEIVSNVRYTSISNTNTTPTLSIIFNELIFSNYYQCHVSVSCSVSVSVSMLHRFYDMDLEYQSYG